MKWNDVTIAQYKKIVGLPKDDDLVWKIAGILHNVSYEDVITMPIQQATKWAEEVNDMLNRKPGYNWILKWNYEVNGTKYRLCAKPNEITTAQYMDFYSAPKEMPDNIAQLIAIFLVPEGHTYGDGKYDVKKVELDLEFHMGMEDALSVYSFFTVLFQWYLRRAIKRAKKALRQIKKNGSPEMKQEAEKAEKMLETYKSLQKEYRRISG